MPRGVFGKYCTLNFCVAPDNSWMKQSANSWSVFTLNIVQLLCTADRPEVSLSCALADNGSYTFQSICPFHWHENNVFVAINKPSHVGRAAPEKPPFDTDTLTTEKWMHHRGTWRWKSQMEPTKHTYSTSSRSLCSERVSHGTQIHTHTHTQPGCKASSVSGNK